MDNAELLSAANAQLPHGPGFRLIDELICVDDLQIHCRGSVAVDSPLVDAAGLPVLATIEYAAQAAAVHGILIGRGFAANRPAYVGAIKDFGWQRDSLAPSQILDIHCTLEYVAPTGAIYAAKIYLGDEPISWGRLTLVRS